MQAANKSIAILISVSSLFVSLNAFSEITYKQIAYMSAYNRVSVLSEISVQEFQQKTEDLRKTAVIKSLNEVIAKAEKGNEEEFLQLYSTDDGSQEKIIRRKAVSKAIEKYKNLKDALPLEIVYWGDYALVYLDKPSEHSEQTRLHFLCPQKRDRCFLSAFGVSGSQNGQILEWSLGQYEEKNARLPQPFDKSKSLELALFPAADQQDYPVRLYLDIKKSSHYLKKDGQLSEPDKKSPQLYRDFYQLIHEISKRPMAVESDNSDDFMQKNALYIPKYEVILTSWPKTPDRKMMDLRSPAYMFINKVRESKNILIRGYIEEDEYAYLFVSADGFGETDLNKEVQVYVMKKNGSSYQVDINTSVQASQPIFRYAEILPRIKDYLIH